MLVWFDCETTGIAADKHDILEVAAIVTDDALNEVARFERVVYWPHAAELIDRYSDGMSPKGIVQYLSALESLRIDQKVIEMHLANGLWADCVYGQALAVVDRDFAAFIWKHAIKCHSEFDPSTEPDKVIERPQLAGSTIGFDRTFIERHLPRAAACLHYRNVDVSSLNELGRRFWPDAYRTRSNGSSPAHRAMADIEDSLRVCRHYLARLRDVGASAAETMGGAL